MGSVFSCRWGVVATVWLLFWVVVGLVFLWFLGGITCCVVLSGGCGVAGCCGSVLVRSFSCV